MAPALHAAGYPVMEIIARSRPESMRRARALARKVGAKAVTMESAALDATLLWLCVPDRNIRAVAEEVAAVLNVARDSRRKPNPERHETRTRTHAMLFIPAAHC